MRKENFEEMLKDALKEYVKDTESKPVEKIKFSKRHEKNMEEIFKSIEEGTLGNFEVEENFAENNNTKVESISNRRVIFNRAIKVAIFAVLAIIVSLAVTPGIKAWKTGELKLFGDNQDEYAWVLPSDVSEMLDSEVENDEKYLEIFGWLPEGTKIESVNKNRYNVYITIANNEQKSVLKILDETGKTKADTENVEHEIAIIDSKEVLYTLKKEKHTFIWKNENDYILYGNFQYDEMLKIIENLNYKKIHEIL